MGKVGAIRMVWLLASPKSNSKSNSKSHPFTPSLLLASLVVGPSPTSLHPAAAGASR